MNIVTRTVALAAGFTLIFWSAGNPGDAGAMVGAAAAVGVAFAAMALAHAGRQRPWSDLAAWISTAGAIWWIGSPAWGRLASVEATLGILALGVALHTPAVGAPPARVRSSLGTWIAVGALAYVVAWWPLLWAPGNVDVVDPATSAGMALRFSLAITLLLGFIALLVAYRRVRRSLGRSVTSL